MVTGDYLAGTADPYTFTLAQKGFDEVENNFPNIDQVSEPAGLDEVALDKAWTRIERIMRIRADAIL